MNYKEIQQAVASIINDNVTVGKHGESLAALAKNAEVDSATLRSMFEGRGNSLKSISKVLDILGYELVIKAYTPEQDVCRYQNSGVRIACAKCGFVSRYTKAKVFLEKGWTMSAKYHPLCPCCSEKFKREREFKCYFAKMKEFQEL